MPKLVVAPLALLGVEFRFLGFRALGLGFWLYHGLWGSGWWILGHSFWRVEGRDVGGVEKPRKADI